MWGGGGGRGGQRGGRRGMGEGGVEVISGPLGGLKKFRRYAPYIT